MQPTALGAFMDGRRPEAWQEVAIMADLANPTQMSELARGLSKKDYMASWAGYATDPRFTYRATRLADVRASAERLAGARDALRPTAGDDADQP